MSSGSGKERKMLDLTKDKNRSLAECSQECSQDITAIGKQILEFILDRKRAPSNEKFVEVLALFEQKLDRMKRLVQISPEYREREELISQLQKCVENRDEMIQSYADNLRGAEQVLTKGIYQANKKLKNMAESEANPVYSEDVIKFSHQISKSYSVAAPQYWQMGDPSRPFPTENELRQSSIASAKNIGTLPIQANLASARSSQFPPRLTSSPINYGASPRTTATTSSQSPKGRFATGGGTPSGSSMGGSTPFRGQDVSPFPTKKSDATAKAAIAKQGDQMMSSDSSSSSSSEDERMSPLSDESILSRVRQCLPEEDGFEAYPFRVESYNAVVSSDYTLDYPPDALAVLVVSTPRMFDVSYKRWIKEESIKAGSFEALAEEVSSPISEFIDARLKAVQEDLKSIPFDVIHDHSFWPNRKPKVLMCTCGHVAGAAYYYRQNDPSLSEMSDGRKWEPKPAATDLKFIGLSLHARYGGHFAFRTVLIFPDISLSPEFKEQNPTPVLHTIDEVRDALEKFNYAWRDSKFRDCGAPKERYSTTQMEYFGKPPAERWSVIKHWTEEANNA